jgi:sRNA-binding protein
VAPMAGAKLINEKYCYRRGPRRAMIDKRLLQLAHYCRSIGYLRSLTTGAVRVDLDGASGTLTIKEGKSSMTLTLVGSHTSGNFGAAAGTDQAAALAAARLATAARRERAKAKRTVKIETEAEVDVKVPRCSALSRPWPCKSSKSFIRKTT